LDQNTLRLLQQQDWADLGERLVEYGSRRAWIYTWVGGGSWELVAGITVADLAQDVIEKTIEGRRKWDPVRGELWPWLKSQLRSEMNHLHDSQLHRSEAAVPESEDEEGGEGLLGAIPYKQAAAVAQFMMGTSIPEPEEMLLLKEWYDWLEQRENDVFEAVSGDQELEEMVEAILEGCDPRPRYLAEELGVSASNIYNRYKRLRRYAAKLMEGDADGET